MTLWSVFRSLLMFGGDLPSNDAFTLDLITNAEVLAGKRQLDRRPPILSP
jgi:alpha-galactosidase